MTDDDYGRALEAFFDHPTMKRARVVLRAYYRLPRSAGKHGPCSALKSTLRNELRRRGRYRRPSEPRAVEGAP